MKRIPDAVLAQHTAILGKTGSGKTSTEKLAVEQVVADGFRVCVLDTIKSDWWGITSSADGKKPGLPFKILGGPHGHVPLHSSAGKAIGQLVGSGKLPLSIIDMADFEPGGVQRFFVDFAQALLKAAKGVVYLVTEEAHEVAPKERAGFGAENMAIHYAKKIATAGRSKGIRLIVATQRVQSLHNAVLGSCDTLIAHRLTTPADQEPVVKWLKANVTKEQAAEVAASLSSLPTGEGFICSGEAKIFERVAFPKFKTFDNNATPEKDDTGEEITPRSAPVDQDELRAIIGDAVKEAEANDPRVLKAEISRLTRELQKQPQNIPENIPADPKALAEAEQRARAAGVAEGYHNGMAFMLRSVGAAVVKARTEIEGSVGGIRQALDNIANEMSAAATLQPPKTSPPARTSPPAPARIPQKPGPKTNGAAPPAPKRVLAYSAQTGEAEVLDLTGPQLQLLKALAWWAAMHHEKPTRTQVAAIAGWKPKGSNLRNRLSELSGLDLVTYPSEGRVSLTGAGMAAAPAPDLNVTLVDSIRGVLTAPQGAIFEALLTEAGTVGRTELAHRVGWEPGGSNLRNRLSELSALEVVEYPSKGGVRLQDWVTE